MAAVPVLRSVRRVRREVALLPRILITPKRTESGGKGAERSGGSKTLVSFPLKQPHVWPSATGENAAHPSTILQHLEAEKESSVDPGQKTERSEPRQEEDSSSSSSSSSDSDSDSDLEEEEKRKEAAEEKRVQFDPKWGAKDQKTQTRQPETREQEILGGEQAGEDLTLVPPAVGTLKQKPKIQNIPRPGKKVTSGDQDLTGEQSEDVAPAVDKKSGKKTLSGGQYLAGEKLVDVAPAVDTQVQNIHQSEKKTPSGGQNLPGEDLVDVALVLDTKSEEKTPSGGQDLAGEDLVDVAPTTGTEKPAHGEAQAQEQAEEGRLASSQGQDVGEMQSSDGNNKDPSGEHSVSSPDHLAESDDLSPVASLTPPPPTAAPPPEEPFDNAKYQNQQHFSYTPFTFVDYDVDLSKFRLPQPSSGRPSPYH